MRSLFGALASLLAMLVIGCSTVDADECWVNTSGGLGGDGPIPIGAGVGASSGDFIVPPPDGPLDYGGEPNPCVTPTMGTTLDISYFYPKDFKFVEIVADDGTDRGGGWQEAKAGLIFGPSSDGGKACVARIGMPLRTYVWGNVPPNIAAIYTANVANAAAKESKEKGFFDLPPGIFCDRFETEMRNQFTKLYDGMGASVTVKSP